MRVADGGVVMARRRLVVAAVLLALVVPAVAGVADGVAGADATREAAEERDAGEEGGLEGAIAERIGGPLAAVGVLLAGVVLLTAGTERLIGYLTRASLSFRLSLFGLAVVFTGFEFDDTVLALVLSAGELEAVALGTALGTALAITGVTLAVAALVRPFPVELPRDYVVLFGVAPLVLVPFVLTGGLSAPGGVGLVGLFVVAFGYIIVRERARDVPVFRGSELGKALRSDGGTAALSSIPEERLLGGPTAAGPAWLGLAVLALAVVVAGSVLIETGSEVVVESYGVEGTVFGATVLTLVLTLEDVLLTVEPVRRGVPEIGIGNVMGSVLFSVSANVGVVALFGDVVFAPGVLTVHLPAVVLGTGLAAYFASTGSLQRWHGAVLGALYVGYWLVAVLVFGGLSVAGGRSATPHRRPEGRDHQQSHKPSRRT